MMDVPSNRRRDFQFFFILLWLLAVQAAPASSSASSLSKSTQPTASSTNSPIHNSRNRDGSFQVLADGTQDLAALVGLFATGSVEAYAVDYSKGYLSTCVATLSLLGLLGWARTLFKIGLGKEPCQKAGFSTAALQPMCGITSYDELPSDKVFEVQYLERVPSGGTIKWKQVRAVKHTTDSMQFVKAAKRAQPKGEKVYSYVVRRHTAFHSSRTTLAVIGFFALCNGLTSFGILIFRMPVSSWDWSTYFGSFGLFAALNIGSWAWLWVYLREHVPLKNETTKLADCGSFPNQRISLALLSMNGSFHYMWLDPVSDRHKLHVRVLSISTAACSVAGYICQYLEVRLMDSLHSGYWLAFQAGLAVIRILVWVLDLGFDDMHLEASEKSPDSVGELHFIFTYFQDGTQKHLHYPSWATPAFQLNDKSDREEFRTVFRDAFLLQTKPEECRDQKWLQKSGYDVWDMPRLCFQNWMRIVFHMDLKTLDLPYHSCRLVQVSQGAIQILPYVHLTYRFGHQVWSVRRVFRLTNEDSKAGKELLFATASNPGTFCILGPCKEFDLATKLLFGEDYIFSWILDIVFALKKMSETYVSNPWLLEAWENASGRGPISQIFDSRGEAQNYGRKQLRAIWRVFENHPKWPNEMVLSEEVIPKQTKTGSEGGSPGLDRNQTF